MTTSISQTEQVALPTAHLGWRLLAMLYDSLPMLTIWLLFSAIILLLRGGQPIPAWTLGFWLQTSAIGLVSGAYLVLSWHRGGQTLGMRPWRLKVVGLDGQPASFQALCLRYLLTLPSLGLAGLGLLWSLVDSERRALHDIGSATRLVRLAKPLKD